MRRRSAREVARILLAVSDKNFGPKATENRRKKHFRTARFDLLQISGRGRIDDEFYHQIQDRLHAKGYFLVDLGDDFAIAEVDPMTRYRKVPGEIVAKYTGGRPSKKEKKNKTSDKKKTSRRQMKDFADRDEE